MKLGTVSLLDDEGSGLDFNALAEFANSTTIESEDVAPAPQKAKRGRGRPSKKSKVNETTLALHIGTNSDIERRSAGKEPTKVTSIKEVEQLIEATTPLLPAELEDVHRLMTAERPLLFKAGTKSKDGNTYVFLFGSAADAHSGMGWYEVTEGGKLLLVEDTSHLNETPSTFSAASLEDMHIKKQNDYQVRGLIAGIISAYEDVLMRKYGVGTIMEGDGIRCFVRITNHGLLGLTDLSYLTTPNSTVSAMDVEPIVRTWAATNGLAWDDFKDKAVRLNPNWDDIYSSELSDESVDSLFYELSSRYRINFPTTALQRLIIKIAKENRINTFTNELQTLEQLAESGQLQLVDHTDIATRYLRVQGTPEQVEALNAALGLWFEAFVARGLYPGCNFRNIPVFIGPQNIGKTRWGIILAGKENVAEVSGIVSSGNGPNSIRSNELMMLRATHSLMTIDEIEGSIKRSEDGDMKKFLESSDVVYRPVYGRMHVRKPVFATFFGTTNHIEVLKDPTGNTRYWLFNLGLTESNPLDQEGLMRERDGIIASAIRSLRQRVAADPSAMNRLNLSPTHSKTLEAMNLQHLTSSPIESLLEPLLYVNDTEEAGSRSLLDEASARKVRYLHSKKVVQVFIEQAGASSRDGGSSWSKIDEVMNRLGYGVHKRVRVGNRTQQRIYALRNEKGELEPINRNDPDFQAIVRELNTADDF